MQDSPDPAFVLAGLTADVWRELADVLVGESDVAGVRGGIRRAAAQLEQLAQRPLTGVLEPSATALAARFRVEQSYPRNPVLSWRNPLAPPMSVASGPGWCEGSVAMPRPYQGPPGSLHGGFIGVLLDQVMGMAARTISARRSLTRYLNLQYVSRTPLDDDLVVRADVDTVDGRKTFVRGTITAAGVPRVHAEGLWITLAG